MLKVKDMTGKALNFGKSDPLLKKLLEVNDKIGFLSFGGSPYDMELPSKCKALLHLYLGGEAVAGACVKIILGLSNPSGKLAESIPYSEKDVPSYGYFAKQEGQSRHLDEGGIS